MNAPVHRLKKSEVVWLANHHCTAHRHPYLQHYNCYLREQPNTSRVGFLDIEASNLKADFGIMLSYAIKVQGDEKIFSNVISPSDIKKAKAGDEDKKLVRQLIEDMGQFDRLVTYYGTGFDIPFIRTRAVSMGLPMPQYGTIKHTDLYYMVRNRFNMSSKRLENAVRVLVGAPNKTRVDARHWRGGVRGDKESLQYILDHNLYDVIDLERLYDKVVQFSRKTDNSL